MFMNFAMAYVLSTFSNKAFDPWLFVEGISTLMRMDLQDLANY